MITLSEAAGLTDGLATVRILLSYLGEQSGAADNSEDVIFDLNESERVLVKARDNGARWHLRVDF